VFVAEYANLSPEAVKLVENLEEELKSMGSTAVLLAYAKYAKLEPETIKLIEELEEKLKEQGNDVILIAYSK
jgi:hypothetical protein